MNHLIDLLSTYGLFIGLPLLFVLIAAWTYRSSAMDRYIADGNIPFYGDKEKAKRLIVKHGNRTQSTVRMGDSRRAP